MLGAHLYPVGIALLCWWSVPELPPSLAALDPPVAVGLASLGPRKQDLVRSWGPGILSLEDSWIWLFCVLLEPGLGSVSVASAPGH